METAIHMHHSPISKGNLVPGPRVVFYDGVCVGSSEAPWRVRGAPGGPSGKPVGKMVAEVSRLCVSRCHCQSLHCPSYHVDSSSFFFSCPKAEVSASGYKVFSPQSLF